MTRFRKWLVEDSVATKVVGPDGLPLVVYHGSQAEFEKFCPHMIGMNDPGFYGRGFYFSPWREEAAEYGRHVRGYHLDIRNPFTIYSSGHMGHDSLHDLRDALADLKGTDIPKTNRELPAGYQIRSEELDDHFGKRTAYSVYPDPVHYGTDAEVYGPERLSKLAAVIDFNDQLADRRIGGGWASGLLRELLDRNELVEILKKNGYDGIFVTNPDTNQVYEYVAFSPDQITRATP